MSRSGSKGSKKVLILVLLLIILIAAGVLAVMYFNSKPNTTDTNAGTNNVPVVEVPKEEVDIIDINSKTRPIAIIVNNTPVAVKVQEGLNKAYMVYELPTEGNTSRLMALFKDVEDVTVGTNRSARHNFIDYALESDAIFVHYGWSVYAQKEEQRGVIDFLNGLFDSPFWRNNPEKLPYEHTAYTSTAKIKQASEAKGYKLTTDTTPVLNYNVEDVDLSDKEDAQVADKVTIPYGSAPNITSFTYNDETKMYERRENGEYCIDHNTKERVTTKNIKVNYSMTDGNYYWDLKTIGSGEGYYITNGYAVPITWEKTSRKSKTKYYYKDGQEIEVSDGRTYIELQTTKQKLTIEANEPPVIEANTIAE